MDEIKVLRPFSTLYNVQQFCCEEHGYVDWWEVQYFYENEIVECNRIRLDGLTEDVDFEIIN